MSLLAPEDEGDGVEVAWEDQERINIFSTLNTRLEDIRDQLKQKREEKEYYDDLETELELADEEEKVLYKLGEAFFYLALEDAQAQLRRDLERYEGEIEALEEKKEDCERQMKELKVQLYAKFGKQINLDVD